MIVSVTGATGHIGSNLIPLLLNNGYQVRALVRDPADHLDKRAEVILGDITQPDTLEPLIDGADYVIHLAAKISIEVKPNQEIIDINITGTENVIGLCLKHKIKRMVHFSTIHSYNPYPHDEPLDETRELTDHGTPYDHTKKEADKRVLDAVANGLDAVILAPTSVFGPDDYAPSLMGQAIMDIYGNKIPGLVPGGYNFVDVRDIAEGTMNAMTRAERGEKYILSGNYLRIKDLAGTIGRIGKVKVPQMVMPGWLLHMLLPLFRLQSSLQGKPPLLTKDSLDILLNGNPSISSKKAENAFGYTIRPFETSISDTLAWFKAQRMLS